MVIKIDSTDINIFFVASNAVSISGVHSHATFFLRSCLIGSVCCDKSGTKCASVWARPKKDFRSFLVFGTGKSVMALVLFSSGFTPSFETLYPANVTDSPIWSLSRLIQMLFSRHRFRTFSNLSKSSS